MVNPQTPKGGLPEHMTNLFEMVDKGCLKN